MRTIAIDPGANGAIAVLEDNYCNVFDLPSDPIQMATLIRSLLSGADCQFVIEKVNAMPKQGTTSMFNFGKSFGTVLGVLGAIGYSPASVSAVEWTKAYPSILATKANLTDRNARRKAGKTEALVLANAFYPDLADKLKRVKDDGRADALLLCKYYHAKSLN
jgi:crossover junction endodeoxyribonuclease RuvC